MKKRILVLSLGGSIIIPDEINYDFLNKFKKLLRRNYQKYKFVIVCGGGSIARKYISALEKQNKSLRELSDAGIRATRENAKFLMQFFGKEANDKLPMNMADVKNNLLKNKLVICGALRYAKKETSDGTAAKLANYLNSDFLNLTNVSGLYTANPSKNKNAKLIKKISWKDFNSIASKIKYAAGQHFVLDQSAAKIIKKNKTKTYILGNDLINIGHFLKGKEFIGTTIEN